VKKAFGLISAIIVLLLIATLMVAVVKFAFISVKHTSDSYLIQRAQLFMQSSIENAIMAIEGYKRDNTNKCLREIHFTDENKMFESNITILRYYCYNNSNNDCPCGGDLVKEIQTDKSHGYVLMKVVVESNTSNPRVDKKIRLITTTLQRP
jgi:hypothetical protein